MISERGVKGDRSGGKFELVARKGGGGEADVFAVQLADGGELQRRGFAGVGTLVTSMRARLFNPR